MAILPVYWEIFPYNREMSSGGEVPGVFAGEDARLQSIVSWQQDRGLRCLSLNNLKVCGKVNEKGGAFFVA